MMNVLKAIILFVFFITSSFALAYDDKETLIIVDQSASMLEIFEKSKKIVYAVSIASDIVSKMPEESKIGLRTVSGSPFEIFRLLRMSNNGLCEATNLRNPIKSNNASNINRSLKRIMPSGSSPLQYTLKYAIEHDFSNGNGFKHIILITDGYENCGGDPCGYIRKISMERSDIKIDVIGIGLKDGDKSSLNCITNATNGKVININNDDDMLPYIESFNKFNKSNPICNDCSANKNNLKPNTNLEIQIPKKSNSSKKSYLIEIYE